LLFAYLAWDHGSNERQFWRLCAHLRQGNTQLACEYTGAN
jgi:hypothetical protein